MPRPRRDSRRENLGDKVYPAASTMEGRENQLISMAYDLVEKRLRAGTASPSETVHFLKMGSQRDRIEREIMAEQKKLVTAKTGAYDSAKKLEALYTDAIEAMRTYSGAGESHVDIQETD